MFHLLIYNVKVKLRNFGMTFWPLAFPLILGTLFFFAFGNINDSDFETVPVAVVKEEHADQIFLTFLEEIKNGDDQLLSPEEMTEEQAKEKLEEKKISGIYYVGTEPALTVASNGIEESILQSVLQSYGMSVRLFYWIWCCSQSAGKPDSTGSAKMCHTDT